MNQYIYKIQEGGSTRENPTPAVSVGATCRDDYSRYYNMRFGFPLWIRHDGVKIHDLYYCQSDLVFVPRKTPYLKFSNNDRYYANHDISRAFLHKIHCIIDAIQAGQVVCYLVNGTTHEILIGDKKETVKYNQSLYEFELLAGFIKDPKFKCENHDKCIFHPYNTTQYNSHVNDRNLLCKDIDCKVYELTPVHIIAKTNWNVFIPKGKTFEVPYEPYVRRITMEQVSDLKDVPNDRRKLYYLPKLSDEQLAEWQRIQDDK